MTVVETRYGSVRGVERQGVLHFRGIPFAAPPVGELRWRPPQPPTPWTGVLEATEFGPVAPQPAPQISFLPRLEQPTMSEDCLTLNVFTPAVHGGRRPVMVWVHGGSFTGGSGRNAWYNGAPFARAGVVVVTINYRLGALGFLHLGDDFPTSGNSGLLDQVAALRWVRENIAAFGGDPGNVTVFGESAGGMSVGALLGMPDAAGLFGQAVPQSGAASGVTTVERATEIAERMRSRLGGQDALRRAPVERILEAQAEVVAEASRESGLAFRPVVDGTVLPRPPLESIEAGSAAGIRVLTGTNRDEMTLFYASPTGIEDLPVDRVVRRLDRLSGGDGRRLYDGYRSLLGDDASPVDVLMAIESDHVFRLPAIRLAEAASRHEGDVWMYLFTWESPALGGALRSCHALEIPFVWHTLDTAGTELFTGSGPAAQALADTMHAAWVSFATSGDPGWPRYDADRRATRVFGPGEGIVNDPMSERRRLWTARAAPA